MPTLLSTPTRVVDTGVIVVDEHVGHASSKTDLLSMAHVKVSGVGEEDWQTPEFDEFVLILKGKVVLQHAGGYTVAHGGESVMLKKGERVKWTFPSPEGAEYVPICVPAFSPDNCNREEPPPPTAAQAAADARRLAEVHARTQHPYLFHLVQKPLWEKAQKTGEVYYPPTYTQDGFTHATADPNFLLEVGNHFYTDVGGEWLCLRFSVDSLEAVGIHTTFEEVCLHHTAHAVFPARFPARVCHHGCFPLVSSHHVSSHVMCHHIMGHHIMCRPSPFVVAVYQGLGPPPSPICPPPSPICPPPFPNLPNRRRQLAISPSSSAPSSSRTFRGGCRPTRAPSCRRCVCAETPKATSYRLRACTSTANTLRPLQPRSAEMHPSSSLEHARAPRWLLLRAAAGGRSR